MSDANHGVNKILILSKYLAKVQKCTSTCTVVRLLDMYKSTVVFAV